MRRGAQLSTLSGGGARGTIPGRLRTPLFGCAFLAFMLLGDSTFAQCVSYNNQSVGTGVSSILLTTSTVSTTTLSLAAGMWDSCPGAGSSFPSIMSTGSGNVTVQVNFNSGSCPISGCACGSTQRTLNSNGQLVSATITLYGKTNSGQTCSSSAMPNTLAHEVGHTLGLANSPCTGYIMSGSAPAGSRTVQPDECSGVEGRWVHPDETLGSPGHPCSHPPV